MTCPYCHKSDLYGQDGDLVRECAVCGAKYFDMSKEWLSPKTLAAARRAEAMVRDAFSDDE